MHDAELVMTRYAFCADNERKNIICFKMPFVKRAPEQASFLFTFLKKLGKRYVIWYFCC